MDSMRTSHERTAEDMPDDIRYAELTVDGKLRFGSVQSKPELREDSAGWVSLPHTAAWSAIDKETESRRWSGGRVARERIGEGMVIWVAGQGVVPDDLPMNEVGGRAVNILAGFVQGDRYDDQEFAGSIVITGEEDGGADAGPASSGR
jgi:hypothetical protein